MAFDYIRDPREIYRRSFAAIRAETDLGGLPADLAGVVLRMVHACGSPDLVGDLRASPGAAAAGRRALEAGAPVLVDAAMVMAGIIRDRLPAANRVIRTFDDPRTAGIAGRHRTTRSAAAVELWGEHLEGAVVAIGNAPTALFRLLELLAEGAPRPALVAGLPVGFVGAAESKQALIDHAGSIPYITVLGRRGGSALAAAAVNALSGEDW